MEGRIESRCSRVGSLLHIDGIDIDDKLHIVDGFEIEHHAAEETVECLGSFGEEHDMEAVESA